MSSEVHQNQVEKILSTAPVVPVMVIEDLTKAVPLARALVAGGLPVLEITLRTASAVDCIRAIVAEVEGAIIGAGTVITPAQMETVERIGCAFAVSPGSSPRLLAAAQQSRIPLLPGAVTATEVMSLLEAGYRFQKFFPAESSGGTAALSALSSPLPQVRFCPTGGITPENLPAYRRLSNVITVGGSWMAPKALVAKGDWAAITDLSREASALKS